MGKTKYLNQIRKFIRITPAFRVRDIELIVKNRSYSYLILHHLLKKGEIKKVIKGWYTFYDDPIVSIFCFKPAYIGLQEALSIYDIWEQETNVVIITTRRIRCGVRNVLGNNVILRRIDPRYFFGFDYLKYNDFFIPVSDVEKTLIDLIYFREIPGEEVLQEIKKRLDKKKLEKYLKKFPTKFRKKVVKILELNL